MSKGTDVENHLLLVASVTRGVLDFFESATGAHLARIDGLVAQPHEIAADHERRLAYIAHTYREGGYSRHGAPAHEISVVDVDRRAVHQVVDISPFVAPHDVEYDPVHDLVYAGVEANDAGNGVLVLEPVTGRILDHIPTPARNSHWLSISPSGNRCYVTHKEAPEITVLDLLSRRLVGTVAVEGGAEEIDVSADGRWAFAVSPVQTSPLTTSGPSRLVKIDVDTLQIVGEAALEPACSTLRVAADRVLVSQLARQDPAAPGRLWVVDGRSMDVVGTVDLEHGSFTMRASPDGRHAYVANAVSGTLSVVDLDAMQVVGTIRCTPGEGGTHGLAVMALARREHRAGVG